MVANFYIHIIVKSVKTYQPVYLNRKIISNGLRECYERWNWIEIIIDKEGIKTVTDLGCAEGYFVRKSVEKDCFTIGVDADIRRLSLATNTLTIDNLNNFGFIKMDINPENVYLIPKADMVIFLSVLHHIMYEKGEEYSLLFMKEIKKITNKVLIFEMGQSNEREFAWSNNLPIMGTEPSYWIKAFLLKAGFKRVEELCHIKSYDSEITRTTFAAYVE
jgi:cyclopropane fatty-acyl-phospholipid synthase-like methyltransferase